MVLGDVDDRVTTKMKTPEVDGALDDVLVLAGTRPNRPQVAQQVVGAQQAQRPGDAQEGEVLEEDGKQQGADHDEVGGRVKLSKCRSGTRWAERRAMNSNASRTPMARSSAIIQCWWPPSGEIRNTAIVTTSKPMSA